MYIMTPITGFHTGVLAGGRDSECTCRDSYRIRPKQFFGRGNLGLRGRGGNTFNFLFESISVWEGGGGNGC